MTNKLSSEVKPQRYKSGTYYIDPAQPHRDDVEKFIRSHDFLKPSAPWMIKENRRFRTSDLPPSFFGCACIMKHRRAGEGYSTLRKISFLMRSLRTNYARKAFVGARLLGDAGVRTLRPIAYWTYLRKAFVREDFFLYEKIEAPISYHEYRVRYPSLLSTDHARARDILMEKFLDLAREVHKAGLYHGDIVTHNILIDTQGGDPAQSADVDRWQLVLIDTDHVVERNRLSRLILGRLIDMKCLRRLDLDPDEKKMFLKMYLGSDYREYWWWILCCWKWWGEHPFGKFRKKLLSKFRRPKPPEPVVGT